MSHLWYTQCPAPTPLSLAAQNGWLETAFDLPVRSIRTSDDPAVRESHYTHALDWSFRQGGNIPAIWTKANGRDTRVLGLTSADEFQAVIALPGSRILRPEDLKGRRIGIPQNPHALIDFHRATALKGVVSALSLIGLCTKAVELIDLQDQGGKPDIAGPQPLHGLRRRLPYGPELLALAKGEVDAVFVKGAEGLLLARQIGAVVVSEFGFHPDPRIRVNNGTPRPLTLDARTLTERPDIAEALVAAVSRVDPWARANPDDAVRLIAREIGVSEEAVWAANGPEVTRNLRLTLLESQILALQHFTDFLHEWGFLPQSFAVRDWIAERPLLAIQDRSAA